MTCHFLYVCLTLLLASQPPLAPMGHCAHHAVSTELLPFFFFFPLLYEFNVKSVKVVGFLPHRVSLLEVPTEFLCWCLCWSWGCAVLSLLLSLFPSSRVVAVVCVLRPPGATFLFSLISPCCW